MEEMHLADCMLCGSCSYVCPSNIPLAQMFALSKGALRRQKARGPPLTKGGEHTAAAESRSSRDESPTMRLRELTAAPHLKAPDSTVRIMWTVVATLMPIVAAGLVLRPARARW
jgi:Na+-translocating ferredoxin:NAD+ oxidoreductase RnfC subunit